MKTHSCTFVYLVKSQRPFFFLRSKRAYINESTSHLHSYFYFIFDNRYNLQATFEATWKTDRCQTERKLANITKCRCPVSGTFIVLLAKKTDNVSYF